MLIGAWVAARRQPNTAVEKKTILGPQTGLTHEVDEFPEAGIIAVTSHQLRCTAAFIRTPQGFRYLRGKGPPHYLARIIHDVTGRPPQPQQAPQPHPNQPNQSHGTSEPNSPPHTNAG